MKIAMIIWAMMLTLVISGSHYGMCQSLNSEDSSHVVQIGQTQPNGEITYICGGAYLGKNMIVLGAHCANRNGRQPDIVHFGSTLSTGFNVRIANITLHYRYKPQFDYHNMAVAQLERNPQSVSSVVKAACIEKVHLKSNTPIQLIGPIKDRIVRTNLLAVGSEKCHEYYNPNLKLRFGVLLCCFCARSTNSNPCTTQHSSPIQIIKKRNGKEVPFLIGHKSIGKSCGTSTPAVYTRYGSYFEWLETVTGLKFQENECSSRY
ncbi:serine protease snake-like [Malaya genurostris]|uniref:serine protease snake-like n=1 Tax=Malaya genurostris TaxID=325434 RepID=UPI0026F3BEE0|nr:serine protease snake-like [Malaya genurostris]